MDSLTLRKARPEDYPLVRAFYHDVIDRMEKAQYSPAWQKGIYPSDAYLAELTARGEIYLGYLDQTPVAAMALNHNCNESYAAAPWRVNAAPHEISVIHLLCVHPLYARRGLAKQLVKQAIILSSGSKCIRLDVLAGNLPALRLYEHMGFEHIVTLPMYYEDTGWTDFLLYELPL